MKNKQKRYKYKNQIYISLLIITILPLIVLGIFSYYTYLTEVTEKTDVTMGATVNQVKNRVENMLDSVKQYYKEVEGKSEVEWLLDNDISYSGYTYIKSASDLLRGPVSLREYISGYTFIREGQSSNEEAWVISNQGMYPFKEALNQQEVTSLISEEHDSRMYWVNYVDREDNTNPYRSKEVSLSGYMLVMKMPANSMYTKSVLLVNFSNDRFHNLISENLGDYDVVALDADGKLIYTSNTNLGNYYQKNFNKIDSIEKSRVITLDDGNKYRVASAESNANGIHYFVCYNQKFVSEGAEKILSIFSILVIITILVLILARIGTRWIYKPINDLTKHVHTFSGLDGMEGDEFSFIEKGFDQLFVNNESLERLVQQQKGMLVELFVLRMIRGELSEDDINQNLERFNLVKENYYAIMGIHFSSKLEEPGDMAKLDAIRLLIVQNMPADIVHELFVPPISHANAIFVVIGADSKANIEDKVVAVYDKIETYIWEEYNSLASSGVSQVFTKLTHFRTAFNESVEALKNNEHFDRNTEEEGSGIISFYSDFALGEKIRHGYDLIAEKEVRAAVDEGDQKKAFDVVDKFVDNLIIKGVSLNERYLYLHRFLIAILLVASDAGIPINQIFESSGMNIFQRFNQIYDSEKIKWFYKSEIITPIVSELSSFRRSHTTDILEQVLSLVKERNGDITLAECAEQLNYHPSYIWKVLKAEKNMTFTDYVAMEKLEIAKEMLLNTNMSVAEIASKLNYTNTQNFIRFFSKHEQITPGKYRQQKHNG